MLRPSYVDLMNVVNSNASDEEPVVQSRYSIVIAAAKRARQLIGGSDPLVKMAPGKKPLSMAVEEIYEGKVKLLGEEAALEEEVFAKEEEIADMAEDAEMENSEEADALSEE